MAVLIFRAPRHDAVNIVATKQECPASFRSQSSTGLMYWRHMEESNSLVLFFLGEAVVFDLQGLKLEVIIVDLVLARAQV